MKLTINTPIINNTNDPAIANEPISTPNTLKKGSPINKNISINKRETIVAFPASISPALLFISIIIGIEPVISITANITIKTENISIKLRLIKLFNNGHFFN